MFVASFPAQFQAVGLHRVSLGVLQYSGKLSREKTFANFTILWLFTKVFSTKFGPWRSLTQQSEQSAKVFSAKIVFFTNLLPPHNTKIARREGKAVIPSSLHPLSFLYKPGSLQCRTEKSRGRPHSAERYLERRTVRFISSFQYTICTKLWLKVAMVMIMVVW